MRRKLPNQPVIDVLSFWDLRLNLPKFNLSRPDNPHLHHDNMSIQSSILRRRS